MLGMIGDRPDNLPAMEMPIGIPAGTLYLKAGLILANSLKKNC